MALNFDSLIIDRVAEMFAEDTAGNAKYLLNNLSNVSINTTSESKDKTDALGVLIKRFFTGKSVEVSAECNMVSLSALANTYGTEVEVAEEGKPFMAPKILTIDTAGITEYTIPEGRRPKVPLTKIYAKNSNGTLGRAYDVGVEANEDTFTYDESTGKIGLPTGVTGKLTVKYEYEAIAGVKVTNEADKFPDTVVLTMKVLVADTCSVDTLRAAYIVFPSFQPSPDCDLTLETDSTVPYSGVAQRDYCADNADLFTIYLTEDDEE